MEGISSRDTYSINSFFLTCIVDIKNMEGVSSRTLFKVTKSVIDLSIVS